MITLFAILLFLGAIAFGFILIVMAGSGDLEDD